MAQSPHLEDGETGERQETLTVQHCQLVVAQVPEIHDILLRVKVSLTLLKNFEDFHMMAFRHIGCIEINQ